MNVQLLKFQAEPFLFKNIIWKIVFNWRILCPHQILEETKRIRKDEKKEEQQEKMEGKEEEDEGGREKKKEEEEEEEEKEGGGEEK